MMSAIEILDCATFLRSRNEREYMNNKAIVTLAIGQRYVDMFDLLCRNEWQRYCDKYGFDLIVIKEPLDSSERAQSRSPAWQKLLICSQEWSKKYSQIVWVDTDIIINLNNAPDICSNLPIEKVSAVETWSIPTRHVHDISLKRSYASWEKQGVKYIDNLTPELYYKNRGIDLECKIDSVVQTGVFACSPHHHRELFEHIYNSYEDEHGAAWNYEMPAMSYEIIRNNYHNWIEPEFNFCVSNLTSAYYPFVFERRSLQEYYSKILNKLGVHKGSQNNKMARNKIYALKNIYDLGFFIHFAGCSYLMPALHQQLNKNGHLRYEQRATQNIQN